jgi:acetyltransferase, GNAT family
LHALRAPVLALIRSSYGIDIVLEDETAAGELYIDTLSVLPTAQGRGIGSQLVRHLCEVSTQPLGLLVDVNNPEAERLYTRLGFEYANHQELAGGRYKHLILKI